MFFIPAHRAFSLDARRRPAIAHRHGAGLVHLSASLSGGGGLRQRRAGQGDDRLAAARAADEHLAVGAYGPARHRAVSGSAGGGVRGRVGGLPVRHDDRVLPAVAADASVRLRRGAGVSLRDAPPVPADRHVSRHHGRGRAGVLRSVLAAPGARGGAASIGAAPVTTTPAALDATPIRGRWLGAGVAAASLFMLVQVLFPLRAHLYGGNVSWHEQGMRFSWRVMTRAKNGSVTFTVREPATGRQWEVAPAKYLTRMQEMRHGRPARPDPAARPPHRARLRRRTVIPASRCTPTRASRSTAARPRFWSTPARISRARPTASAPSAGFARPRRGRPRCFAPFVPGPCERDEKTREVASAHGRAFDDARRRPRGRR